MFLGINERLIMELLCPISNWDTAVCSRGQAKGNTVSSRTVVAADNWNWVTGTQRGLKDDGPITGEKFYGNMVLLLGSLDGNKDAILSVINALSVRLGKKIEYPASFSGESLEKFAKRIDDEHGTSYMREYPPKVYKQIFKMDEE